MGVGGVLLFQNEFDSLHFVCTELTYYIMLIVFNRIYNINSDAL